jgi:hypothetical protein
VQLLPYINETEIIFNKAGGHGYAKVEIIKGSIDILLPGIRNNHGSSERG